VITGPIASGKSTVADALSGRFREAGRAVAVLDLDDVVDTIGGFVAISPDHFRQAQVVYGELVGAWLRNGFDVIAHGPLFERRVDEALRNTVPDGIRPRRVQLLATYDAALERVGGDPSRALSKDPELLRLTYNRFESLLPTMTPAEWTFDTTTMSSQEVADELAAALLRGR
jgi:hypothetical protein